MNNKINFATSSVAIALLLTLLAVQFVAIPASNARAADNPMRSITVVGEGVALAKPDFARANIGVETVASTVAEAVKQNNDKMNGLIAKIKGLGIADKDIQTSAFSVSAERNFDKGGAGVITGYRVSNMVAITVRDISQVGAVLTQATQADATNIFGISFGVDDPTKYQAQARAKAIADAQARADDVAKLGQVNRGSILSLSEINLANSVPLPAQSFGVGKGGGMDIPVESGMIEIRMNVQAVYAIQ